MSDPLTFGDSLARVDRYGDLRCGVHQNCSRRLGHARRLVAFEFARDDDTIASAWGGDGVDLPPVFIPPAELEFRPGAVVLLPRPRVSGSGSRASCAA